jgi:hypothetical protein
MEYLGHDARYHKTVKDRLYLKVPEDVNNDKCVKFFQKMEEIDQLFGSQEYKNEKFGKSAKVYQYIPIVKESAQWKKIDDDNRY